MRHLSHGLLRSAATGGPVAIGGAQASIWLHGLWAANLLLIRWHPLANPLNGSSALALKPKLPRRITEMRLSKWLPMLSGFVTQRPRPSHALWTACRAAAHANGPSGLCDHPSEPNTSTSPPETRSPPTQRPIHESDNLFSTEAPPPPLPPPPGSCPFSRRARFSSIREFRDDPGGAPVRNRVTLSDRKRVKRVTPWLTSSAALAFLRAALAPHHRVGFRLEPLCGHGGACGATGPGTPPRWANRLTRRTGEGGWFGAGRRHPITQPQHVLSANVR